MNSDRNINTEMGFTIIELMIVLLVLGILAAIAIPIYRNQIREAHRSEARSALIDLAAREQRYYSSNFAYTDNPTDLGYQSSVSGWPVLIDGGNYDVSVSVPDPTSTVSGPSFLVIAVPVGAQAADTECAEFTIDSQGNEAAYSSSNADTTSQCWG